MGKTLMRFWPDGIDPVSYRFFVLLVLVLVGAGAACHRTSDKIKGQSANKITILVASSDDFLIEADRGIRSSDGLPLSISQRIQESLIESARFDVVERSVFRRVIEEQNFGQQEEKSRFGATVDTAIQSLDRLEGMSFGSAATFGAVGLGAYQADVLAALADRGEAVGADMILIGSFSTSQQQRQASIPGTQRQLVARSMQGRLRLRLIDVEKGTIVAAGSIEARTPVMNGSSMQGFDLEGLLGDKAASFTKDALYPSRLLSIAPPVISRGSSDGVSVGDVVQVDLVGSPVMDGNVKLGTLTSPIATVKIVSVTPEFSTLEEIEELEKGKKYRVSFFTPQTGFLESRELTAASRNQPFNIALGKIDWSATTRSTDRIPAILTDLLEQKFQQNRLFAIVDRRQTQAVIDELDFQSFLRGEPLELRLNQLSGADYLLVGRIDEFRVLTQTKTIEAIGRQQTTTTGSARATFHILSTRQGLVNSVVRVAIENASVASKEELTSLLADKAIHDLTDKFLPFEVIAAAGPDQIYLNRGQNWNISRGDLFLTMNAGQTLTDSSGMSFGVIETETGRIEVISVEPSRAIARVVSGSPQSGNLVRVEVLPRSSETKASGKKIEW
jgi:curli biogenesis system outer membrane secretion channel CsgG